MLSQNLIRLAPLVLLGTAAAAPSLFSPRSTKICYDSETSDLLCYTAPDNTPQDVAVDDVSYIAAYLRAYGAQTKAGRLYTMEAADAPDCGEWAIYSHGTAQAIAKHLNNTVDTSVLFADIANTIDGGAGAGEPEQAAALIGCGSDGGSLGVVYNASNPAYSASTYPAGHTPDGVLVKIVATGA
ncbi:hypothetical protein GGR52DRAFT_577683 [Hypoxylon sp. FL1284]|nr:hypothetical protein GGR52DRAFT_577683 [Hypoxylon sp. FL1284]